MEGLEPLQSTSAGSLFTNRQIASSDPFPSAQIQPSLTDISSSSDAMLNALVIHESLTSEGEITSVKAVSSQDVATYDERYRVESELIANLSTYSTESIISASGGEVLSLRGGARNEAGTASFSFKGPEGDYDIILGVYDEKDGAASFELTKNGIHEGMIVLDRNLGSGAPKEQTRTTRRIASALEVQNGDIFTLSGLENKGEYARLDFIDFVAINTPDSSISDAAAIEGTDDFLMFDIALSAPSSQAIILQLEAVGNTATAGIDYISKPFETSTDNGMTWQSASNNEVTFPAGETAVKVRLAVIDDDVAEAPTETVTLSVAKVVSGRVNSFSDTGTGSILDDDVSPTDSDTSSLSWRPLNEPGTGGRIDSIAVSPYDSNHLLVGGDILGARVSTDQADNWSATSGWLNYEIADFTWDPDNSQVIWAGSLSGPHVSTDGGKTWAVRRTGFPTPELYKYTAPVEKVLFDPNSDNLLAFGGDHRQLKRDGAVFNYGSVWISNNNGKQWNRLSRIVEGGNIMAASYAGNAQDEIYAAVWKHGFFYSRDDGKTWVQRNQGLPSSALITSVAAHPTDSKTAWVTIDESGIYKTTNGGENWQLLSQGVPTQGSEFWTIAVGEDGRTLYAGNKNYKDGVGVYKSTDSGTSWQRIFFNNNQIDIQDRPYSGGINPWWIEVDQNSSDVVYVGTDNAVYRSLNGGKAWSVVSADKTSLGWQGNGFSGLVSRNIEWNPYEPTHLILQGMDGAKAVQSWDTGRNWRIRNPGLPSYDGGHDVTFAPGYIFAAFGQWKDDSELVARSSDLGLSWSLLKAPISPAQATQIHVDPNNPDRLWVVANQQLWFSDNATQTTTPRWKPLNVGSKSNPVGKIEAVSAHGAAFYIATDSGIYYTEEGVNFTPIGGLKDAKGVSIAITPSDPNTLYAVEEQSYFGDYGVWRYSVLDNSWARIWNNRNVTAWIGDIAVHPHSSDILAIITNDKPFRDETQASGVWLSKNGGKTWQQETVGLPLLRGSTIEFSPDGQSLVVGLGGGGFYMADL